MDKRLLAQAMIKFLAGIISIGVLVFLPAGSFAYWQGWLLMGILFVPMFGWIDSTLKKLPDGRLAQRLAPRRKNSHWTKLNMDRCLDLEDRGLMTPAGKRTLNFVDKR
jgi:hypothetical protein